MKITYLLENAIDPTDYQKLAQVCTKGWDPAFASSEIARSAIDDVVFRRHDNTVRYLIPWLQQTKSLTGTKWIDFGSGCGSSSLALSHYVNEVHAYEIDSNAINAFIERMSIFDAANVHIHVSSYDPEQVIAEAVSNIDCNTSVLFLAVIEHLLEHERILYLQEVWKALAPGQILVVAETPNLACWFDTHTHQEPLLHILSDEVFFGYLQQRRSELRFRDELLRKKENDGLDAAKIQRRRYGIGATYHLFETAFETDLNEITVTDGYHPAMETLFPLIPDDHWLISLFDTYDISAPIGFSRSVLSFVFRKPVNVADAATNRSWNIAQRERVIKSYSSRQRYQVRQYMKRIGSRIKSVFG